MRSIFLIEVTKLRLAWRVGVMGTGAAYTEFWSGKLTERDHFGDPVVDGRFNNQMGFQ